MTSAMGNTTRARSVGWQLDSAGGVGGVSVRERRSCGLRRGNRGRWRRAYVCCRSPGPTRPPIPTPGRGSPTAPGGSSKSPTLPWGVTFPIFLLHAPPALLCWCHTRPPSGVVRKRRCLGSSSTHDPKGTHCGKRVGSCFCACVASPLHPGGSRFSIFLARPPCDIGRGRTLSPIWIGSIESGCPECGWRRAA